MAKSEAEKGQRGGWITRHRKRLYGNDVAQLSRALKAMGIQAEEPTVRGWEAGARPKPETRKALERLFGEPMPEERPPMTVEDLVPLLQAQTEAITGLVDELRLARTRELPEWAEAVVRAVLVAQQAPEVGAASEGQRESAALRPGR